VCDEPHPLLTKEMLGHCVESRIDKAYQIPKSLWDKGYPPHDIITNIFRVCKNHQMPEYLKLEFIKVYSLVFSSKKLYHIFQDYNYLVRSYQMLYIHMLIVCFQKCNKIVFVSLTGLATHEPSQQFGSWPIESSQVCIGNRVMPCTLQRCWIP